MSGFFSTAFNNIKTVLNFGMSYEDQVLKKSQSIGKTEAKYDHVNAYNQYQEDLYSMALRDIGEKKYIAYFDKSYSQKKTFLQKFSKHSEIEYVLDIICDSAIVNDENNMFATLHTQRLDKFSDDILNDLKTAYSRIYDTFKFGSVGTGWKMFREFLIEGIKAFEIIYDENEKIVIGFKELDPSEMRPIIRNENGILRRYWILYEDDLSKKHELADEQVIYISYSSANDEYYNQVSYIERLIRSFNLLRLQENTRAIWYTMNSTFRMKMVVPTGSLSGNKAKQRLAELMSLYKEDVKLDFQSGELYVNGSPGFQYYKNYLFPSKKGDTIEMDSISYDGPDLTDNSFIDYWNNKFMIESRIPRNRFRMAGEETGSFGQSKDDILQEEAQYYKFLSRLRSVYQEILIKPLKMEMYLKHPQLKNDVTFNTRLGIKFYKDNIFEEEKQMFIEEKRVERITTLQNILDEDDEPYIPAKVLIEEFLHLPPDLLEKIEAARKVRAESKPDLDDDF